MPRTLECNQLSFSMCISQRSGYGRPKSHIMTIETKTHQHNIAVSLKMIIFTSERLTA